MTTTPPAPGILSFDADLARRIESVYTTADVVEQRRIVRTAMALTPGERVLDIGVGPGLLAAEMAADVGPTGQICGTDISDSMLAIAGARASALATPPPGTAGIAPIELRNADVSAIPYADETFDVAVSTQVLEYVDDIAGALTEIARVLRPGGRVLLLDTDWDSIVWRSSDDARMERILAAFERHLVDPHLPRTLTGSLRAAGFGEVRAQVVPILNVGFEVATYSAGMLEIVAGYVPGRAGVTAAEAEAWAADLRGLGDGYFFCVNRFLFCATRPS